MLDELISQSLRDFQSDCLNFCEHHYPTIHNRGMNESHLGKALARRIVHSYDKLNIDAFLHQLDESPALKQPVFRVDAPDHQIYIVAHRLISANLACRKGIVKDMHWTLDHIDTTSEKEKRVILVADHWIDRSSASKSVPSWWLGHQPIHQADFAAQGVRLLEAEHSLAGDIELECALTGGLNRIFHPFHRQRDGLPLYKYLLLTATYPL
ncbi:hypothetical protein A1OO_14585 [Enterovibrio norvegicus FF-33]|uniref:Uncharacterized protein n=1 Tax=Enterovibrio norvegicus FF-454 TaxID=1185651 RepID=A0A1E5CC84_9GAMM|nr:hypothetical protein [Enterovibrio norvegicus]OEE63065.1 hypothetical protein A1OK_21005 [Enterovibrio norvegicus FF-454]OEE66988.1 hypothetical protein A1OO_14585 [Enterovibrio norvegicus FF-33]